MYYGLTRVLYAIARDGLLPSFFFPCESKHKTTYFERLFLMGVISALIACFVPLEEIAELVNIGTLNRFYIGVAWVFIALRLEISETGKNPLNCQFYPLVPKLGALFGLDLIANLSPLTLAALVIWMGIGLVVYFFL